MTNITEQNVPASQRKTIYDTGDISEMLGVNVATARRMCANGELPAVRIGRKWYVPAKSLEQKLAANA